MFARPPAVVVPVRPSAPEGGPAWLKLASNPVAAAAGAAGLFIVAAVLLILVAGDPHAGAPSVRVKLGEPGKLSADALHGPSPVALPADGAGPILDPASGQAVITLPQGGQVTGAPGGGAATSATPARLLGPPLPPAPIAGLVSAGPGGLLPIIGKDGRTPFAAYARPFASNGRPKIALVVGGLGLNASATKAAIERLPAEVTLSFVPYADGLQAWVDQARAAGHEVVLEIPMEPLDYPNNDPGPYTLMAQASPAETAKRMEWLLSRATGYFAVTNYLGGRFIGADAAMGSFMAVLKGRGLGFVDDGSAARRGMGAGAPRGSADTVIDQDLSSEAIDHALTGLEAQALGHGQALGAGFAYPITVEQVSRWAAGLPGRGYQLAPVSAMMRR